MFLFTECIYLNGKHRNTQNGQNRNIHKVPDLLLVRSQERGIFGRRPAGVVIFGCLETILKVLALCPRLMQSL